MTEETIQDNKPEILKPEDIVLKIRELEVVLENKKLFQKEQIDKFKETVRQEDEEISSLISQRQSLREQLGANKFRATIFVQKTDAPNERALPRTTLESKDFASLMAMVQSTLLLDQEAINSQKEVLLVEIISYYDLEAVDKGLEDVKGLAT